jgi:hypothetical protein
MPGKTCIQEPSGRRSSVFKQNFVEAFRSVIYGKKPEYPVDAAGIRQAVDGGGKPSLKFFPWKVYRSSLRSYSRRVIFCRFNLDFFRLRCGFSQLFQGHAVDVSAPLTAYVVVIPSALFKSLKSKLDFLFLN